MDIRVVFLSVVWDQPRPADSGQNRNDTGGENMSHNAAMLGRVTALSLDCNSKP